MDYQKLSIKLQVLHKRGDNFEFNFM